MTTSRKNTTFNYDDIAIVSAVHHGQLLINKSDLSLDINSTVSDSLSNSTLNIYTISDETLSTHPIDPNFFARECQSPVLIDNDIRRYLETTWHLLEAAGLTRKNLKDNNDIRVGIYLSPTQKFSLEMHSDDNLTNNHSYQLQGNKITNHIIRFLDLSPSKVITDNKSTVSINAGPIAYQSLLNDDCQLAIVIGITLPSIIKTTKGNEQEQALKNSYAHKPWAVLLKKLPQAISHKNNILAILKTYQDDKNKTCISALEISSPPVSTIDSEYISQEKSHEIIVLSANSPDALLLIASQLLSHIQKPSEHNTSSVKSDHNYSLTDLAYTLQFCREEMNYRLAMVVNNFEHLSLGLAQYLLNEGHATAQAQQTLKLAQSITPISLHRGDIKSNSQLQSLLSGSSGESMIKALLIEGNFNDLALYWTQGGIIPWKSLYQGKSPNRVNLPGYPFYQPPQQPTTATDAQCLNGELGEQALHHMTTESIETILLNIWKELLGSTQISRHQNFFEIGGDSHLGMHMMSLLRDAMDIDLPLNYLYEAPTVAKMSEKLMFMMALSATDDTSTYQEYEEGIIL
ncbi:hypothetical protein HQQ94_02885 [Shewanella sp. VB17]|uniref:KS-MAT linker domain-containing protein n=1 Tax=Shewanella sp. VB17 TaxID=2739432 RepID=UPI0015638C82|nr:phosphopantetheine-binding protein [Shewanella sp. VB17]NRD72198.1 hypothetical protein [Shewanella sp. VB17]